MKGGWEEGAVSNPQYQRVLWDNHLQKVKDVARRGDWNLFPPRVVNWLISSFADLPLEYPSRERENWRDLGLLGGMRPSLPVVNLASVYKLLAEKIWSWPVLLISVLDQEPQLQEATDRLPLLGGWGVKEEDKWSWFPASGNCSIVRGLEEPAFGCLPHGDHWQSV